MVLSAVLTYVVLATTLTGSAVQQHVATTTNTMGVAPKVSCANATSTALLVTFPLVDDTDLYFLELYAPTNASSSLPPPGVGVVAAPFRIQTTLSSPTVLHDLLPDQEYVVVLRSHMSSAPSIVWNWRNATGSDVVHCRTPVSYTHLTLPTIYSV